MYNLNLSLSIGLAKHCVVIKGYAEVEVSVSVEMGLVSSHKA